MKEELTHPYEKFLRKERIPHIWCEGCGNGIILNCFIRALDELNIDLNKIVVVSGIGCIGRISGYINTDSFHTTHGRPIAFATGVKLANPELKVVVISGDGDLFSMGGNHFIHAARRNLDIQVICGNNFIYGMTGGQHGATTPLEAWTTTTPYGSIEHAFNLVYLAAACGAVYVARWTTFHVHRLTESIKKALQKEGFSFIEAVSQCPELYGRYNSMETAIKMMRWFKEASTIENFSDPAKAEISPNKIVVGEFVDVEKPSYGRLLREMNVKIIEKMRAEERTDETRS